jgi:hypothetical protein
VLNKICCAWPRRGPGAEERGDVAFLTDTLVDDFVAVGPRGFQLTKADRLQRHRSRALQYVTFALADVQPRSYGDAAILTGRAMQAGKEQEQDSTAAFRPPLLWVRRGGRWRLAGLHLSPMLPPPPAPTDP